MPLWWKQLAVGRIHRQKGEHYLDNVDQVLLLVSVSLHVLLELWPSIYQFVFATPVSFEAVLILAIITSHPVCGMMYIQTKVGFH